jgi:sterol desaturase/sphingolipid hydroxylase (fatty acid hydroxylase superfamily)
MITILDKNIITITALVILYTAECVFPYFDAWKGKTKHALRNAGIVLINAVIINLLLLPLIVWASSSSWGVFNQVTLSWWAELALTILVIDALTYFMHVLNHKVPFLWRFHRMHHSDTAMDVTTGARFHIGEHIISLLARSGLYAVFSMNLEFILIYETVFLVSVLFHHSNISISEPIDKIYRMVFTSPNMHKVHHSNVQSETDSNYTSLFSFWDRLFGTYKIVKNPKNIVYGIKGLEKKQSIIDMLLTPFKK